ncbi:MAG: capsular polysaccharide synthesis protein [Clostridium sp.]|uniref:glycosyltransferase family 32 protein n=1 Tax=Clostridium sp. TaxID=1506 RepID=UPI002FCC32CE
MIPKVIHYCWFGNGEKPQIVKKCIENWKVVLNDYEIIEWNERNFDIKTNKFVQEAYRAKKYAFVSDYVRAYVLYEYGGIYLDTDVEVYKSFDDLLDNESFWGFEEKNYVATSTIGAAAKNKLIKEFLDSYECKGFKQEDGTFDMSTNVYIVTEMLKKYGLETNGELQKIKEIGVFYPQTYFSPYDYINCRYKKSENTYAIHYFYKSWLPFGTRVKSRIKVILSKIIGGDNIARLRNLLQR